MDFADGGSRINWCLCAVRPGAAVPTASPVLCVPSVQLCPVEEKTAHELAEKEENWLKLFWRCKSHQIWQLSFSYQEGMSWKYLMTRKGELAVAWRSSLGQTGDAVFSKPHLPQHRVFLLALPTGT